MALDASVVRLPDGTIGLRLVPRERAILRALLEDLRDLVGDAAPVPGLEELDDEDGAEVHAGDAGDPGARAAIDAGDPVGPGLDPAPIDAAEADAADAFAAGGGDLFDALADREDPAIARLYPDARPDDPEWSARFRDMIRGDLDDARREQIAVVADTLDARTIDDAQADAWLHVLNDLRLVMGARLDITDDDERDPLDPEDPDAAARIVFAYTGWLEAQFIDILADALPPVPGDESDPDEGLAEDDS